MEKRPGYRSKGMGLGLFDLLFPFLIPIKGVAWLGQKLMEQAESELTDKSRVQEELLNLQTRLEMDEISEEEYKKKEAELMERLETIRKFKEEKT